MIYSKICCTVIVIPRTWSVCVKAKVEWIYQLSPKSTIWFNIICATIVFVVFFFIIF